MRCCLLIAFLHLLLGYSNCYQDGVTFTTPNYPVPYTGQLSQRKYVTVNETYGVAVVFEQFLASAHDCFIACPTDGDGCSSLCGDAMDHGLVPKILRIPGNLTATIVSIDQNDGFPHSGISAKIIPYDLKKLTFFECNDQIDISSGETFYLISQNYPSTPTFPFSKCSINFSTSGSRQGIRFAVYDFYLNHPDSFEINGTGSHVEITGFATEDEPVVYYFKSEANVVFSVSSNHSFLQKRFYILVTAYEISNTSSNCGNVGNYNLQVGDTINFGTQNFGNNIYTNNLKCGFNFTRTPGNDSIFALAIQYETEKCCDTMSIDGLNVDGYQEIYQGYQFPSFFFTYNLALSFFFQSDPVIGGTGFNATLEHLDCTCPASQVLVKNETLTSPGYTTSITYCSNIICIPKIEFQDDLYDLQMVFTDINLRSYSLTNNTDSLSIFDAYSHQMVQIGPNYLGFNNFWATVSPVTVQFVSNYLAAMPLNLVGRGFAMNLNLVKKNYVSEKVIFNDGFFFKDISKLNLTSGTTYEFQVDARKGNQIHVYFFTKTMNQVFIDIFNGDSMDADRIDNKILYSNINENGASLMLSTTSERALIHIKGNPELIQDGTDFQAMVTDVKLPDGCEPLVYSLRDQKSIKDVQLGGLGGQSCNFKILHFTDDSYSQSAFMNVQFSKSIDKQVFLGLTTYPDKLIAQYANDSLPQDLFTNYLVIKSSTNDLSSVSYNWDVSSGLIARTMQPEETVILISDDYGKSNSTPTTQQFSVQLEGESNVQTGLTIQFLADSGVGTGTLTWSYYNSEIRKESFTSAKKSLFYNSCGDKLRVDYTSPGGGPGDGMYVKITRADLRCSAMSTSYILMILFFIFVIL